MKLYGITIDTKAIAAGLIDMVRESPDGHSYMNAIRFGMTPAPVMQSLEKCLGEKFDAIALDQVGITAEDLRQFNEEIGAPDAITINQKTRARFIADACRAIHCDMLRIAGCVC